MAILGVLIVAVFLLASVWTDILWYSQLGFFSVLRVQIVTQGALFLVFALITAAAVAGSMLIAYRSRPVYAQMAVDTAALERYREGVEPLRRLIGIGAPIVLALFVGSAASQRWEDVLLWWNGSSFGTKDAQFGQDISFYVFTLPWLQFLVAIGTTITFLAGIAAIIVHYLYGGLRLQGPGRRMTSTARTQLAVIAALFLLLRAIDFWLGRFSMTTGQSRLITGLTYTDANASVHARGVLAAIAAIIAILFLVAAFMEKARLLPLYGLALLIVSAIVVGELYPAAIQRFRVTPSQQTFELPYIKRNIDATRMAYGLDKVQTQRYTAKTEASPADLQASASAIPGIRLVDPALVSDTYKQLEQNKQYYQFGESLDVDRYTVNGVSSDMVVALRELNLGGVQADKRNWYNDHFVYTHGYGMVAAYGNRRTADGSPVFSETGLPVGDTLGKYEPRIYFGEYTPEYSIVGGPADGPQRELDHPDDSSPTQQSNTTYTGEGGVGIGSYFRRVLYALKFREQNILLTEGINSQSKIMYDRSPRDRVAKVAPYLSLDGDPYPAIVDGRIVWIVDGFTTSANYPYSTPTQLSQSTSDALTQSSNSVVAQAGQQANYIRNSVKATVDTYDGSVKLYVWDDSDPIIKAWQKVFKTELRPMSQMSADLMSHVRYPEDLFKVQRELMAKYHVTDPASFFSGSDFWQVSPEPTAASAAAAPKQPPYYLSIQMPGQADARFSLTSTFIPTTGGRNVLKGYLAVDADAGSTQGTKREGYGTLRLLPLPTDAIKGPGQMQNDFNANPTVTGQLFTLRGGTGGASSVELGNMLVLPMAEGMLYVQPVYVRGRGETSYPLLQKVLVGYGAKIGFADTLDEGLKQVFNTSGTTTPSTPSTPSTGSSTEASLNKALTDAMQAIKDSEAALAAGDFTKYGDAQKRLKAAVQAATDADAKMKAGNASPSPSPSPSPSASN